MDPIVIEPQSGITPAEIAEALEKSGLRRGGAVSIRRSHAQDADAWSALLVIALVAIAFVASLKRKREADAIAKKDEDDHWSAELLKRVFEGTPDVEALEREVEDRTGVSITVEEEEWPTAGMVLLNRAYGDDEPDISGMMLKERNPDYRP